MVARPLEILIIAHDFPPLNRVGSQRTYSWARYWREMGARPVVFTLDFSRFPRRLNDAGQVPSLRDLPSLEVVRTRDWWRPGDGPPGPGAGRVSPPGGWGHRLVERLRAAGKRHLALGYFVDPSSPWIAAGARALHRLVTSRRFDAVVSSFGPSSVHMLGALARKWSGATWVADYRDLWSDERLNQPPALVSDLIWRMERRCLRGAAACSTVSPELAEQLEARLGRPAFVVPNGFDPEDHRVPPFLLQSEKRLLLYTGTLQRDRTPVRVLAALQRLAATRPRLADRLELAFLTNPESARLIEAEARGRGVESLVSCRPWMDRTSTLGLQKAAAALLFLDWEDEGYTGIVSGKIFEYMAAGPPIIVCGGSQQSAAGQMVRRSRTGVVTGTDDTALLSALEAVAGGDGALAGPRDDEFIEAYTRRRIAEAFLARIEALVRSRQAPAPA